MEWRIKVKTFSPLVFQSKLLCLSLFYLLTTFPLSLYVSFSQSQSNKCNFLSIPQNFPKSKSNDPFSYSYPPNYGEHKHAVPSTKSNCNSPIHFSDYKAVFEEMQNICKNLSKQKEDDTELRYMSDINGTFSGNFSMQIRKSFFNYSSDMKDVPCGMINKLPIKKQDRLAMEKCTGITVVSAIFNNHDKIRQPRGLGSKTFESVCFFMFIDDSTLEDLILHQILQPNNPTQQIGAWHIVSLPTHQLPYKNPAMNGVIFKHLIHRLFPNSKFSIWVDAKLQMTVDPVLLVHSLVVERSADVAVSKHPFNVDVMEEAVTTVRWRKWKDVEGIRIQMERYCESGFQPWSTRKLSYTTDVPDTALIIRKHGLQSNLFSCLLFNELEAFNPRDQLSFAFVRDFMNPKININMFETDVFEHIAIEYRHNIKIGGELNVSSFEETKIKMGSSRDVRGSSCEKYLLKLWGEYVE